MAKKRSENKATKKSRRKAPAAKKAAKAKPPPAAKKSPPAARKSAKKSPSKKASPRRKAASAPAPAATKKKAAKAKKAAAASPEALSFAEQETLYDKAIEAFHARSFSRARELFDRVADGPDAGLHHRAEVHAAICARRLASEEPQLETAEDLYNYGVKLINDREIEEAERRLEAALEKSPDAAHVHYALGVAAALREDAPAAAARLERAIELDPAQRLLARSDADLAAVSQDPAIAELLQGEHDDAAR